jgi:hypothetical protein
MKKRAVEKGKKYIAVLLIGIIYYLLVTYTEFSIPCIVKTATGYECPACGVTRMILSLVEFDIPSAFSYNPFLFITLPIIIAYIISSDINYIKNGRVSLGKVDYLLWAVAAAAIIYGIMRNI